jgi:predicted transcriptional regulator
MDHEVVQFRRAAARENRDRRGGHRRYSARLQQQAVAYWTARADAGDGLQEVASALGLTRQTLRRWMAGARFRPVQVDAAPTMTPGGVVVVITDAGIRVEGLDLDRAVAFVTRVR